ncbi:MAG: hypothetical protein AAGA56_27755 [Myxococcota bacterium]
MWRLPRFAWVFLLVAAWSSVEGSAYAEAKHECGYSYRQAFGTAVRLLKVDLGFEVKERDPDMGYVLFAYTSTEGGSKVYRGAFAFVETEGQVRVTLQIPEMPGYHEQVLLDRYRRKLLTEHGDPPREVDPDKREKNDDDKTSDEDDPPTPRAG